MGLPMRIQPLRVGVVTDSRCWHSISPAGDLCSAAGFILDPDSVDKVNLLLHHLVAQFFGATLQNLNFIR